MKPQPTPPKPVAPTLYKIVSVGQLKAALANEEIRDSDHVYGDDDGNLHIHRGGPEVAVIECWGI